MFQTLSCNILKNIEKISIFVKYSLFYNTNVFYSKSFGNDLYNRKIVKKEFLNLRIFFRLQKFMVLKLIIKLFIS